MGKSGNNSIFHSMFDWNRDGKISWNELAFSSMINEQNRKNHSGSSTRFTDDDCYDEDAWQEEFKDIRLCVRPDMYENREEYLEALKKYAWKLKYKNESSYCSPLYYATEEQYLSVLKMKKLYLARLGFRPHPDPTDEELNKTLQETFINSMISRGIPEDKIDLDKCEYGKWFSEYEWVQELKRNSPDKDRFAF